MVPENSAPIRIAFFALLAGTARENPHHQSPLNRRKPQGIPRWMTNSFSEQSLEEIFEDAFAVETVGHDDDTVFRLVEDNRVMAKAFVVPFF